ncbi:hypothetical protein LguiA_024561 [Lonicera macranthoides]
MVPFPAQGHLRLSCLFSSYNFPIHYVDTTTHIGQAQFRLHGLDPFSAFDDIHFHEFKLRPLSLFPQRRFGDGFYGGTRCEEIGGRGRMGGNEEEGGGVGWGGLKGRDGAVLIG